MIKICIVFGSPHFIMGCGCRQSMCTCFDIIRFVTSLDRFCDEREKRVACACEIFLEKGGGDDNLHTVEENPSQEESSNLVARIGIR